MAMNPFLAQALISGGKAILGHGLSKAFGGSRTKFKNTGWGKYLKQISEKGMYTPGMQANILGKVGTQVGQTTSDALSRYKGNLIKSGMENSIAGARGIKSTALSGQQKLVDTAKDVSHQNELSKIQAKSQYLQGVMQDQGMRENEEIGARNKLVGGLVDAGTGYFTDKLGHDAKMKQEYIDIMKKGGTPQKIYDPTTRDHIGTRQNPDEYTNQQKMDIRSQVDKIIESAKDDETKQYLIEKYEGLYPWLWGA